MAASSLIYLKIASRRDLFPRLTLIESQRDSEKTIGRDDMTDAAFLRQIEGFSLTTAEILYRLPDHPKLLQSYIWQDYDMAPRFPRLAGFLDFWAANLDGTLYRIRVAHSRLIQPAEFSFVAGELRLH